MVTGSPSFEDDVYPVVVLWSIRWRLTDDQRTNAASLAWTMWRQDLGEHEGAVYAWWAIRKVRSRQGAPGMGVSAKDATRRLRKVDGGKMARLRDRSPGPLERLIAREEFAAWESGLSARDRHIVAALEAGVQCNEIARQLGISPARVTQLRHEIARRAG